MRNAHRFLSLLILTTWGVSLAAPVDAMLAVGLIDRKFPKFFFCPIETRDGNLVNFVAPANGSVRITFAADNFYPSDPGNPAVRTYNEPRIDNVMLIPRALWDANNTVCSTDCFTENGQLTAAPTYPSDAASLAGLPFVDLLDQDPTGGGAWEGGAWSTDLTAPRDDATGTDCNFSSGGGSIALGLESDGDVVVSSAVTATGLTPGTEYVVFAWFFIRDTGACEPPSDCLTQLQIIVDETGIVSTEHPSFGEVKADFR